MIESQDARRHLLQENLISISCDPSLDAGDLNEASILIARIAQESLGVDACSLWSFNASANNLQRVCLCIGPLTHLNPIFIAESQCPALFELLHQGRTASIFDASQKSMYEALWEAEMSPITHLSFIHAPIRKNGHTIGLIQIENISPRYWHKDEITFVNTLVELYARAIASAERFAMEQELVETNYNLERIVAERTETLLNAQKNLMDQERFVSLGGMVAGMAHEINTPIGVALMAASHLEDQSTLIQNLITEGKLKKSDLEHYLSTLGESMPLIQNNLRRAGELIGAFKEVAAHQSSELTVSVNLSELIQQACISLSPNFKTRLVELVLDLEPNINWQGKTSAIVQVVTNLIQNSLLHGFTIEESGLIQVTLKHDTTQNQILLVVQDTGQGIPDTLKQRVFEPFFTTKRGAGGTGLGLSIVHHLVHSTLQGTLVLEDAHPKGVVWRIVLSAT